MICSASKRRESLSDELLGKVLSVAHSVFGKEVGTNDDLFSLGGDSLNAVELTARLEEILGREVELHELWEADSFREFAAKIASEARS
jgi:acyl carrier protein